MMILDSRLELGLHQVIFTIQDSKTKFAFTTALSPLPKSRSFTPMLPGQLATGALTKVPEQRSPIKVEMGGADPGMGLALHTGLMEK